MASTRAHPASSSPRLQLCGDVTFFELELASSSSSSCFAGKADVPLPAVPACRSLELSSTAASRPRHPGWPASAVSSCAAPAAPPCLVAVSSRAALLVEESSDCFKDPCLKDPYFSIPALPAPAPAPAAGRPLLAHWRRALQSRLQHKPAAAAAAAKLPPTAEDAQRACITTRASADENTPML